LNLFCRLINGRSYWELHLLKVAMRIILLIICFFISLNLSTSRSKPEKMSDTEQLPFEIIAKDLWSAHCRKANIQSMAYRLFFDDKDWSKFWQEWYRKPTPRVDFSKNFIIYILQGLKKTGGYKIDIVQVFFENKMNVLNILLRIKEPGSGQAVDLGETSPYVIMQVRLPSTLSIKIDNYKLKIKFLKQVDNVQIPIELMKL